VIGAQSGQRVNLSIDRSSVHFSEGDCVFWFHRCDALVENRRHGVLTKAEPSEQTAQWYKIAYPASEYTFPHETLIDTVRFDETYIHIELTDRRILSIPLWWIPTLSHAAPEDRARYEISRDRTLLIWDSEVGPINDELRLADYLLPRKR
jgi:hypothetical protein